MADEAFEQAVAMFTATALSVQSVRASADGQNLLRVQFQVSNAEKGMTDWRTEVWIEQPSTACGYPFQVGVTCRVHPSRAADGRLTTNCCLPIEQLTAGSAAPASTATGPIAGVWDAVRSGPVAASLVSALTLVLIILFLKLRRGSGR